MVRKSALVPSQDTTPDIQSIGWDFFVGFPPHKIFLWNWLGRYLDQESPNPRYGHFLGTRNLQGAMIPEVLPAADSSRLMTAIHHALASHELTVVRIDTPKAQGFYQSVIQLMPMHEMAMGWVNDFPIQPDDRQKQPCLQKTARKPSPCLTPREWEIATLVAQEQSNEEIACRLGITERTAKFHVSNILEKFQLDNRTQLITLIPLLQ